MQWKARSASRSIGDIRTRLRFAWIPTCVHGYWFWLEHYVSTEKWTEFRDGHDAWLGWLEVDRNQVGEGDAR